jgi:hypothetical protein
MKKIIRLKESDLTKIVKMVLFEQSNDILPGESFNDFIKRREKETARTKNSPEEMKRKQDKVNWDKTQRPICIQKVTPFIDTAKKWWLSWLNNSVTKGKFMSANKMDEKTTTFWFNKYISAVNNSKVNYFGKYDGAWKGENNFAFVNPNIPDTLFINCSSKDDNPLLSIIHEIGHILYIIKPFNSDNQIRHLFTSSIPISKEFGKDIKNYFNNLFGKIGDKDKLSNEMIIKNYKIEELSKLLSVSVGELSNEMRRWAYGYQRYDEYICEPTEKQSNIAGMRKLFGLKPGDRITPTMLKPYILFEKEDVNVTWFLACWANQNFRNLKDLLEELNNSIVSNEPINNTIFQA